MQLTARPLRLPVPHWRVVALAVGGAGAVAVLAALVDLQDTGLVRPWAALIGIVATVVVNRVYVVVSRRGQVVEGIDIAEAPIVALAMLLPPGEAVLAFVLASVILEIPQSRAHIKKVFNVGVRAAGAGVLVAPLAVVGTLPSPGLAQVVALVCGAVGYSLVNAGAVASVVASVHARTIGAVLREGLGPRLLVWVLAVTVGLSAGFAGLHAPAALAGVGALLALVSLTAHAAARAQQEGDRLHHLLDASTRIQASDGVAEQEVVLVEVASQLLLWKDVEIRDAPPTAEERGGRLSIRDDAERWLVAAQRPGSDPWSADDERVVEFLARSASVAFDRASLQAKLSRQALIDPLTGVANRRRFDDEVGRLAASRRSYALVLCDLDHFKTVNDRLGHDAGDELLRIAAARLSASVRTDDLVARLGGDEFVVLLPDVTSRDALEGIRTKFAAKLDQPVKVGRWQLSCLPSSLGVASAPRDGRTPRDVLRAADESMYDVKRKHQAGRTPLTVTLPDGPAGEADGERPAPPPSRRGARL